MPRKISQIDLKNRSQITNSYQVVCTNPLNFELARVPATQFRGAGLFTSKNDPTLTPENPIINEYIDGDIYVQDTERGQEIYFWNSVDGVWDKSNRLNGIRLLSATDFPDEIDLDVRGSDFISDLAYENDYYLNKTLNLIYGAYNPALGFRFGSIDFSGYMSYRPPATHTYAGDDLLGYDNPKAYLDRLLTDPVATAKDKLTARHPTHGDTVHITLENDEGHGGWVYYFSTDNEATGSTLLENYNIFLGTNVVGDQPLVKKHFRAEKTWNEAETPTQNDKKYRQGDNVLALSTGVLYYNYQEGQPENTTDLGLLFEGSTVLKGSSIKSSKDVNGNWVSPTADDSKYQNGDFVLAKDLGTPRIHGPYVFGAGNDLDAWPLHSILRLPVKHRFNYDATEDSGFKLPTTYASNYPINNVDGVETMIVDGDTALLYYNAEKSYTLQDTVSVTISTVEGNKAINWGDFTNRIPTHPLGIKIADTVSIPDADALLYYNTAIVRNKNGDNFKFVEDFNKLSDSKFEIADSLRPNVTHVVEDASGYYTPPTTNSNAAWGGASVITGDTLEVRCTATGANKVVLFTASVNSSTQEITWQHRRSKYGIRTLSNIDGVEDETAGFTPDSWDVSINAVDGDFIITSNGTKYVVREDYDNSFTNPTIRFVEWFRPNKVIVTEGETIPANFITGVTDQSLTTTIKLHTGDERYVPKVGDVVRFEFKDGASKTGKVKEKVCTSTSPVAFGEWYNPNPVKIWNIAEDGTNTLNDKKFSTGDFVDNPTTKLRYGPYVEGASTNDDAWPKALLNRGKKIFIKTDVDLSTEPTVPQKPKDDGGIFELNAYFMEGDILRFVSTEGKVLQCDVTSVDYVADTITTSALYNGKNSITWNTTELSLPVRNNNKYSKGDYILNGNSVLYGPYVEYQTSDALAWPTKGNLRDNVGIIVDTGSVDAGVNWKIVVENGVMKLQQQV
jgi:hypothetical protein